MTNKEKLWQQYYAAIRSNNKAEAERLLKLIHMPPKAASRPGGCSRCRKRF
jgi:hypothetical protein